jgi:hypothetical protein
VTHSPGQLALAGDVERVEAEAWAQLNGCASTAFQMRVGLNVRRIGAAACIVAARSPFFSVNRVLALGCPDVASEAQLDELLATFKLHLGVRGHVDADGRATKPVAPEHAPDRLRRVLRTAELRRETVIATATATATAIAIATQRFAEPIYMTRRAATK